MKTEKALRALILNAVDDKYISHHTDTHTILSSEHRIFGSINEQETLTSDTVTSFVNLQLIHERRIQKEGLDLVHWSFNICRIYIVSIVKVYNK
jgi:hypothetical protein